MKDSRIPMPGHGLPRVPSWRTIGLWAAYLVAFSIGHQIAQIWAGISFFSLWYPAAGLRFAFLWHYGARWTLPVAAAELLAQSLLWSLIAHHDLSFKMAVDIILPSLATGSVIAVIRREERRNSSASATAPLPLALATILVPTFTALVRGGWEWMETVQGAPAPDFPTSIFLLGDMLGILIVAPFLLWLGEGKDRQAALRLPWPALRQAILIFVLGWLLAMLLPDLRLMPVLLMMTWIGLRHGSKLAWVAIILSSVVTLLWSASVSDVSTRLALHIGLAVAAVSAYLAGSYSDAQQSARESIARRDRLLFQAERLKTVRAMSVAVIHEISQPLSTLAIESRHLAAISRDDAEIAESAALIARKVETLSTMIRRLRRFGGRAVDEPSPLSLGLLLSEVVQLAIGETGQRADRVKLVLPTTDVFVMGQEIELTQAFLNLVRNALSASPADQITVMLTADAQRAQVAVANPVAGIVADSGGFGVGNLIAGAIMMAHGGTLIRKDGEDGVIRHETCLPTIEAPHA
ncbi:sensor histidine kinase [Aurantiacibacter xanthus]|uniref:Sensor histidine kinase n=1 Tax=Aurantiacibacter xanthus TaxID=1784712 RepID=A0A3A1PFF6_9SPHN|nr:MASE1 domain-containing protein [Aurantiacibacter xanthus]RIV92336.1 sensor histidine kinase [Aurantiacibacter xanthus]